VFTSDNGGNRQYTAPLKGGKGQLYEGGLRVPTCVWWSGINQPGRSNDTPILSMDFYPTMLDIAGIPAPQAHRLDGESLLPLLKQSGDLERDTVYWHFPSYIGRSSPCSAIRVADYKLITYFEDEHVELYDLKLDPGEERNLASTHTTKAKELKKRLETWWASTHAALPAGPNPKYDPQAERPRGRQGRKSGGRRQKDQQGP
jgi:arylsulfatase A-like enzyme